MKHMKLKKSRLHFQHIPQMLLFPTVLFYYELVFNLATMRRITLFSALFWLLSGLFFGGAGYLLSSLCRRETANRVITTCLLALSALPYTIQFFVYKAFNVLYDLNTIASGAGGVITSYGKETAAAIFSPSGILLIVLFFLPTAIYLIVSKKRLPAWRGTALCRCISGGVALLSLGLALLLVFCNPFLRAKWSTEYHYQNAVEQFGLLPGMGLDVKFLLFPADGTFVPVDGEATSSTTSETVDGETDAPAILPLGKNELPIDFDALNDGASPEIVKLNNYIAGLTATSKNAYTGLFRNKNLIFITAEAFSAPVIDEQLTPTLYRLATKGINFLDFYQLNEAGTTGGEYLNLFGMLPMAGGTSFKNTKDTYNYFTMGSQFNRLGYYGKAYHNNTYTYYDRHLTHNNLGYSDGYMGYGNGMEQYVQNKWPQSDYEMIAGTLPTYISKERFNIYYMSVSGHSNYTLAGNSMTAKHWDRVKDLPYSDTVKGYLAANLDLEDGLAYLVSELEAKGIADDTVIVLVSDHFPYGLTSGNGLSDNGYLAELYGYPVEDCFDRDYSRLIIWSGCLEDREPILVTEPTSSLDILPTLSNLFGTDFDSRFMPGRDVFSGAEALVFNTSYSFKTNLGTYYSSTGTFFPVSEGYEIPEGYVNRIKSIIRNKLKYCTNAPQVDYLRHVFGE